MKSIRLFFYLFVAVSVSISSCKKDGTAPNLSEEVQQDIAAVDDKIEAYLSKYNYAGASLAISKDGKLVYRKGYGYADKEANTRVNTDHQFRVASLSKPITAVAIMKLVQEGKISLDSEVFGNGAILGNSYGTKAYSAWVKEITVKHLLQNTAGGWRNFIDDAAFSVPKDYTTAQVINHALDNIPLVYKPGTHYHYSNTGFLMLGAIIEHVSGKTYESYVVDELFRPLGATATAVAGDAEADRLPKEVKYYPLGSENPYTTYPYNRNAAALGWLSTPSDMLRFMTAVDSLPSRPDILSGPTLAAMVERNGFNNYAHGFYVASDPVVGSLWYHDGSMPGTHSFLFRSRNGFCVAIVFNSRYDTNYIAAANEMIGILLEDVVKNTGIQWQDIDQF